jgi:hypothetical protein
MGYSIYFYLDKDAIANPVFKLATSPLLSRAKELTANPSDQDFGFGWFKPKDIESVHQIVGWIKDVQEFVTEFSDDDFGSNPLHQEFVRLTQSLSDFSIIGGDNSVSLDVPQEITPQESIGTPLHSLESFRDQVAAMAMQGLLAADANLSPSKKAIAAVQHADALIKALKETQP